MDKGFFTNQLAIHAQTIRTLVNDITNDQARWKPDEKTWSILEVLNHLLDEERQDFRVRLEYILFHPGEPWPTIDPQGWVIQRQYNQRDLDASLNDFIAERQKSLEWLEELNVPDWDVAEKAPWGKITAGDMFAAWTAHDLLHIRQLVELHWAYVEQAAAPYQTLYAGEW